MFRSNIFLVLSVVMGTGLSSPSGIFRVVNGTDAWDCEFPFIVSIRNAKTGKHGCGASILDPFWLLTAAHCVHGRSVSFFNVQYGVTKISKDKRNVVDVDKIIEHKKFKIADDIALIRLKTAMKIGDCVQPVVLPNKNQITPDNMTAVLIGWGREKTGGSTQTNLKKVELKIFPNSFCDERYPGGIRKTQLCAGVIGGGKGQCKGDSGGPLTINGIQIGIVSWSRKPCASPEHPGVFTRVSSYINWINSNMNRKNKV